MGDVTSCGICHGTDLWEMLDLGDQPLAEHFGQDTRYPLKLLKCATCGLVQLSHIVDAAVLFPPGHPYTTATSAAQVSHFRALALSVADNAVLDDVWVDIGANDGTLLEQSSARGMRLIAVEPTRQARKCLDKGLVTYQKFFTSSLARQIRDIHGPAKVVTACNVLAHVPDPHDFMAGVAILLYGGDGMFITENHDLASITSGLQIDSVYHEHLRYYSPATLGRLLDMNRFDVVSSQRFPGYGGSFQVRATPQPGSSLASRAFAAADALRNLLNTLTPGGEVIYGVGASTRGTTLIHYAKLAPYLTCVAERPDSEKIGKRIPGTKIPIVEESALISDQPDYALLLSYHLGGYIIPRLTQMGYKGSFIIPLPEPEVIDVGG